MGACARNMESDPAEIKPAQCCIKLVFSFDLYYDARKHKIKISLYGSLGVKRLIPKFAIGCSSDTLSSASHSYTPFPQILPQNVLLFSLFAIFHVTVSNYISLFDLKLCTQSFCSFRATCTAHCDVLHFTIFQLPIFVIS